MASLWLNFTAIFIAASGLLIAGFFLLGILISARYGNTPKGYQITFSLFSVLKLSSELPWREISFLPVLPISLWQVEPSLQFKI
jgi:hypothetical protein